MTGFKMNDVGSKSSLRAERSNPDCGAAGLLRSAGNDEIPFEEPATISLSHLRNIGPAALGDFALLGIETVVQLGECEADTLYNELQIRSGQRQDPCVWDVFAATIHQARTGEALNWWAFTAERKAHFAGGQVGSRKAAKCGEVREKE
jgi:Pathogenicity locus